MATPHSPKESHTLNILQINLQRSKAASTEALQMVHDLKVDILVIQEPYVYNKKIAMLGNNKIHNTITSDNRIKTGIIAYNNSIMTQLIAQHSNNYFTTVKVDTRDDGIYIISFYCSPDEDLTHPLDLLSLTMEQLKGNKVIVMGDFNAKSHLWHSPKEDPRGYKLCELIAAFSLTSLNDSPLPTFFYGPGGQLGGCLSWQPQSSQTEHHL
ncbi:uncharacterized protein LOC111619362 [Centruroides sculpturatus]|uniref:uncharacterized protein LOC111619362 n=1 Tax=Centruroides sculpturatus TaxID=218467 RepID=UPI000C6CFB13|nr:uncharacterized protein LOC111619362 [Centruroides sculpturatus]